MVQIPVVFLQEVMLWSNAGIFLLLRQAWENQHLDTWGTLQKLKDFLKNYSSFKMKENYNPFVLMIGKGF